MGVGALSYLERTEGCCGEEQEKIFTCGNGKCWRSLNFTTSFFFINILNYDIIPGSSNFGKMWEICTSDVHAIVVP